jgi:DNA-binding HxlR family transcriptional regulator
LTGVWSFLLTENKVEKEYSIDQMGALVTNMTNNMQNATLKELHETGILNLTDVNLDEPKATLGGKTLGEYKIVDIVKVIGMMG